MNKCNFFDFYIGEDYGVECNVCGKMFYGSVKAESINKLELMCKKVIDKEQEDEWIVETDATKTNNHGK